MKQLIFIAHNLRSAHNVGSLLRTADGLAVDTVHLTGYTPYPPLMHDDPRLPHERAKIAKQIDKTALGAAVSQHWQHSIDIDSLLTQLRASGYTIAGLEQTPTATPLKDYQSPDKLALILGREVDGIEPSIVARCDIILEIPMLGSKESFNVVQAAAMAGYHCRYVA